MALGLIGKKIGMSQLFDEAGLIVPVTVLEAGPCVVLQNKVSAITERIKKVKKKDGSVLETKVNKNDGYNAVKLGYIEKTKNVKKSEIGQCPDGVKPSKYLKEFRIENAADAPAVGSVLKADLFTVGEFVDITATSKGKGFQGVMKRYNFSGGKKTHGSHFHRAPGSIGQCASPAKVFKGKKMPGRMGNKQVTVQHLKIVSVDPERNLIIVKGAVPGAISGIVNIKKSVKKRAVQ
ncbi:MAG: 50S ribosomal protein L3 [Spirochaetes bacterium]|nr:50S ribosomal protein L3 [Spirochaetota bacterium]